MKRLIVVLYALALGATLFAETEAEAAARLVEEKKYEQAKAGLEKLIAAEPNNDRYLYLIGKCSFYLGDDAQAQAFLKRAIAINSKEADYYNYLGAAQYFSGDRAAARESYLSCITLDQTMARPFEYLGHIFRDEGDNERAREYYGKACALNDKEFDSFCGLGDVCLKTGDTAGAETAFAAAVRLDPKHYGALRLLIVTKYGLGKYGEGEELKRTLIAIQAATDIPDLKEQAYFVFDRFTVDGVEVGAAECFKKEGELYYHYMFVIFGDDGHFRKTVNLESSVVLREFGTPYILGSDDYSEGRKIRHSTFNIGFTQVPDYETMKEWVAKVLRGEVEAGTSSEFGR
ncbi:MAG: tetratricopeptide repeat protein [Spirochaetales bacterium]|nr:tetratricopeptide repeat protein [Spirochaetales bacterium]